MLPRHLPLLLFCFLPPQSEVEMTSSPTSSATSSVTSQVLLAAFLPSDTQYPFSITRVRPGIEVAIVRLREQGMLFTLNVS